MTALDRDYCNKWGEPATYPAPPTLPRRDQAHVARAVLAHMRRAHEADYRIRLQAGIAAQQAQAGYLFGALPSAHSMGLCSPASFPPLAAHRLAAPCGLPL